MNVERQRRIFVEPWSDSIHIALWSNGFLYSFHDFSKSNAFSKILIRTKYNLHKIFFQKSMLSSSKTSWMFFNFHQKMTLPDFQLIIIIITVATQVTILNQFS